MAHDVFVSYSQNDKATSDAVVAGLEQEGIRCWIAPRDIMPGSSWGGAIVEAINAAKAMILILSSDSNDSRQVLREVERAVSTNTVIIPFRIEEIQATGAMSYFLGTEHWLDALTPPVEQHIGGLVTTVNALLGSQSEPKPAPPSEEPAASPRTSAPTGSGPSRNLILGGAAVATIAVALGIGIWLGGSDGTTTDPSSAAAIEPIATTVAATTTTTLAPTTTTSTTTTVPPTTTTSTTTSTTEALPQIDLPPDYRLFDGSHNGFVMGFPNSWFPFDLSAGDVETLLDEMATFMGPGEIDIIREMLEAGAEITMMAFHPDGDPNFNLVTIPRGPLDTIDFLEAMIPDQFASVPGTEVLSVGRVDLNGAEALRLVTRTTYPDNSVIENHQYYLLEGDLAYLATFTIAVGGDTSDFDQIMETFVLTG